eukprot:2318074-Alexandrium_andersonii.AAC.1
MCIRDSLCAAILRRRRRQRVRGGQSNPRGPQQQLGEGRAARPLRGADARADASDEHELSASAAPEAAKREGLSEELEDAPMRHPEESACEVGGARAPCGPALSGESRPRYDDIAGGFSRESWSR